MPFATTQTSGNASSTRRGFLTDDPYSSDKIQKQIDNAAMRVQDSGYSVADANQRNWFEKATNLPAGQNWFLDTLELLGRGGNAVKNVIDKSIVNDHEDAGTALYRGFAGREKVSGVDLAKQAGIENKAGQWLLGTGLDIGLDPTTYIPGGVIAKGIGAVAKPAAGAAKAAYNAAEAASPALKTLRETQIEPLFNQSKDTLGHMFVPQYKWEDTLSGTQDDTLKKLFNDTNKNIKFMGDESMRNIGNIAKETGINTGEDVGRLMEKDLVIHGPRPARQYSQDQQIQQAAQDLMKSNTELRQWAIDNGIDVNDVQGYMTHILSAEERANKVKKINIDRGMKGNQPNSKIIGQRQLQGSAEDVNDMIGRKFFEPNAYFSTAIGQKRLVEYGNAVKFRRDILSNPEFAQKYTKGTTVPDNAVVINTNNYSFIKDPTGVLPDTVGGEYIVTKGVKEALDRYQHLTTDEGTKGFLKAYDGVQNMWKRFTLFSPGYHVRNLAGAMFNNSIAGMNLVDLNKYTGLAMNDVMKFKNGTETPLLREFREQGLGSNGLSKVEFSRAGQDPEEAVRKTVNRMSKTGKDKAIDVIKSPFQTSQELGDGIDQVNRFALYKWSREKKNMTPEEAALKVKQAQFDYSNLTPFEQQVMARAVPFYRWMRNNIPFQIRSFINDPRKYEWLNKGRLNAQDAVGLDENNVPDYMKEQFALPVYGSGGKGKMLGLNLPLGDLTKLSNPLGMAVDGLTPLIKTPIELATNYNMFYKKPIERFAGQEKQFDLGPLQFGLPAKTAYALEQATGQIGRGLSSYLQKPENKDQDTAYRLPTLGINSMLKNFDAEKYANMEQLQRLKQLQELMLYIQQQEGEKPRTVNQIKGGR